MKLFKIFLAGCLAAGATMAAADDSAASFPSRTVRIIVPFGPGGTADILARRLGEQLSTAWQQPVVVENRAGGATVVGAQHVATSAPDGLTLLLSTGSTTTLNPLLMRKLPYDPRQLVPVAMLARVPMVLGAGNAFPPNNLRELVAFAKANPGKVSIAGQGVGATSHMIGELFRLSAGIDVVFVQYKGVNEANADLVGGHVNLHVQGLPSAFPLIRSGKLKPLAITSESRMPAAPSIPTFAEGGVSGVVQYAWYGLFAPAGTPTPILEKINKASVASLDSPVLKAFMESNSATPGRESVTEFAQFVTKDMVEWREVINRIGLKID